MTLCKDMNEEVMAVDTVVSAKPFPFLRLPKDIRFMIYDLLQPNTNKHIRISNDPERDPYCAVLVIRSFDMSILRTCKTINDEAHALLYKTARQLFTKCAAQIVLPKGDAQENMITTFLGAVKDSYKSLCTTHGARGSQDMFILGDMPQHKAIYFGLSSQILQWYASRVAFLLWAGPSFTVHVVPIRRTREDFWKKLSSPDSQTLGTKWDKPASMTAKNLTTKVKAWVGPFDWTIEVPGVLPLATRNLPFDNSIDNILKIRRVTPRAYGMDEDEWVKCWLAVEIKTCAGK